MALGLIAIFCSWGTSIADEPAIVKKASRLSLRKTTAATLPTHESMMFTDISISSEAEPIFMPTLCLAVDSGSHHLLMDKEVELIGLKKGHAVQAKIERLEPREEGNLCSDNAMMITTDLSDLDNVQNDLYTGSLDITISVE